MRTVRDRDALPDALAAARREAIAAFGDDRLILERLVEGGRATSRSRSCSTATGTASTSASATARSSGATRRSSRRRRRRRSMPAPPRGASTEAALDAGARGRLRRAPGTCEFLVDRPRRVCFLEMNTRLQVEHPVTEAVTGRDLVADQLRIAGGRAARLRAGRRRPPTGHAIEVRLYAEDAEAGFLPATGRIERLRWPSGDGIRVDAGIDAGDEVGGAVRPDARQGHRPRPRPRRGARPADGRRSTRRSSSGLVTNLRFLRWLVRQPVVRDGGRQDRHARPDLAAGRLGRASRDPRRRVGRRRGRPRRRGRRRRHLGGLWRLNGPGDDPPRRRRGRADRWRSA